MYLVALSGAANDIIAVRLHVSVEAVTCAVRVGLFAVPSVVYAVTERWVLGLRRRDRDKVLHGRETGVVRRLRTGISRGLHGDGTQIRKPTAREYAQEHREITGTYAHDGGGSQKGNDREQST